MYLCIYSMCPRVSVCQYMRPSGAFTPRPGGHLACDSTSSQDTTGVHVLTANEDKHAVRHSTGSASRLDLLISQVGIVRLGISGSSSGVPPARVRQDFDTDAMLPGPDEQNMKQANAVTRLGHDLSQHGKLVKPQRVGLGADRLSFYPRLYCLPAVDRNH